MNMTRTCLTINGHNGHNTVHLTHTFPHSPILAGTHSGTHDHTDGQTAVAHCRNVMGH